MADTSILQARVAERLAELRRSPRDVSLAAGLGPDAIRTIMSGRSRSPRGETLAALASELQCDVGYLLGTQPTPFLLEARNSGQLTPVGGPIRLPITSRLSVTWGSMSDHVIFPNGGAVMSDIYSLPDYRSDAQELFRVEDHHASDLVPRGGYLHTRSFLTGMRTAALRDRDVVVLQRFTRRGEAQEAQSQVTCRRVRLVGDGALLELPSATIADDIQISSPALVRPEGQDDLDRPGFRLADSLTDEDGHRHILIVLALVLRGIHVMTGPDLGRDTWRPSDSEGA